MTDRAHDPSVRVPTPIRIALLLQDLEFGGTQRYAIHLSKHLDRRIFEPHLWILRGGMQMAPLARDTGASLRWLSESDWVGPRGLTNLAWSLLTFRPHILYTLTVVPNIWGRLFGTIGRIPVIISSYRDGRPKQYERLMWHLSTRIIANSQNMREQVLRLHGVDPGRVRAVPNAVNPEFFHPDCGEKASEPTVVFAGRLEKEKDPFTLLEGFKLALERVANARLEMFGNGSLREKLLEHIRNLGLQNNVTLSTGVLDMRPALGRAWVFVLPSLREASPNVILEAMACELPVVGTRAGGVPELVRHGETGFVLEPRDPHSLAEALTVLLRNEELRRRMGSAGRRIVKEEHSMERMVGETEKVFIEAVNETALTRRPLAGRIISPSGWNGRATGGVSV